MLLNQLPLSFIMHQLLMNPNASVFPFNTQDYPYPSYPQGVPRFALLQAFQALSIGLYLTVGNNSYFFAQAYLDGQPNSPVVMVNQGSQVQ